MFGVHSYEHKRNIMFQGVSVLESISAYSEDKYQQLLTSMTMQYDSVRGLGY